MLESYVKKILGSKVYDLAVESPLSEAPLLSRRLGVNVSLKREDMQSVYSFKLRGAYNKMAQLSDEQKATGVITCVRWQPCPRRGYFGTKAWHSRHRSLWAKTRPASK
jgi:threonine dehydratase